MDEWGFLESHRYLIHDRDTKFTDSFRAISRSGYVGCSKITIRKLHEYFDLKGDTDE